MAYAVGSLVRARGREWVVLPESEEDLLVLRPLGGTEDEVAGIYLPLESVEPARFDPPDPSRPGDHRSCRMLRDAVRLGFRSSGGPFRSFARIAVEPRPYQLVPLLMALRLDPVRLLIADDVGIGKTVEAGLIARELFDRGEIDRIAVLCPSPLAEQWTAELREKFHLDAQLVLPSTATRLDRECRIGESIFERHPITVVSTDFIKSDRRREEFLRSCPQFVIVDEAHTCAWSGERGGGRHQRHALLSGLALDRNRRLVLVTATPHSGNEAAFRSLLLLLDPSFESLPDDLTGAANESHRRRLSAHFIQRRRADIKSYLAEETPFPVREDMSPEPTYRLHPDYSKLFQRVLQYARDTLKDLPVDHRQRVRWWSMLALLRSLGSSPAAAAATLRTRAATADTETIGEADEIGRRTVLDLVEAETAEGIDLIPGSQEEEGEGGLHRRKLLEMALVADSLAGAKDAKLQKGIELVRALVEEGYSPIVFCRFIATAEYVADALRGKLRGVEVAAVTGTLPPAERIDRISELAKAEKRVLVCTDCLSEGVNLQEPFNAVLHYDLSWNPTRHEQREGRVDRYGQPSPRVRILTYYGTDSPIDGIVLDVLLRKHQTIRSSLGISVPVPVDSDQVVEALFEGLLLRERSSAGAARQLILFEDLLETETKALHGQWDAAADREKRSRSLFAHEANRAELDEVGQELRASREALGSGLEVRTFTQEAARLLGAVVSPNEKTGAVRFDLSEAPVALREAVRRAEAGEEGFIARYELPVRDGEIYLGRTHPIVEGLASYVMDTALDPLTESPARRCGVVRTRSVSRRTTLLLTRFRYHIVSQIGDTVRHLLAEEVGLLAFAGAPASAEWLPDGAAEALLAAAPDANIQPDVARAQLERILEGLEVLYPHLDEAARERGERLLDAHRRVRRLAGAKGARYRVEPQLPPDVLGIYIFLPVDG